MIVTTHYGEKLNIRPGMALCGIAITEATLTAENCKDFYDPRFNDWMREIVMPRFIPPKEKNKAS